MKLCFVFVAKNASSSIKHIMQPWTMVRSCHPPARKLIDGCTTFTVVRDPFTRFVSGYREVCKLRPDDMNARRLSTSLPFSRIHDPLKKFAQFVHDIDGNIYDLHLVPQVDYIKTPNVPVAEWLTFENITKHMGDMLKRLKLPGSLPRRNVSDDRQLDKKLLQLLKSDMRLRRIVERIYAEDFKLYKEKARA
jgi:hypothetical protein